MKKVLILMLFVSLKMFGQTPKMEVVAGDTENVDGIKAELNKKYPTSDYAAIKGINNSLNDLGYGVYGEHSGEGAGVYGKSREGAGIYGESTFGEYGVVGKSAFRDGVYGLSSTRRGIFGEGHTGVYGKSYSGEGVFGESTNNGYGVKGISGSGIGGYFSSSINGKALITETGKVGMGTSNPSLNSDERVEINGRLRIRDSTSTAGVWFNNSANSINPADGAFYGMKFNTETGIWIGNAWRFWVNNAGNANFTGTVTATGFPIASDIRYKKNIQPLENTLSKVQKIVGVSYDLRKDEFPEKNFSDQPQIGFIAQDLEKIFPEMVFTDEKGYKSVDYARLTPVLVEALKELSKKVDDLKLTNDDLRLKNEKLESRLDRIEAVLNK